MGSTLNTESTILQSDANRVCASDAGTNIIQAVLSKL